MCSRAHWLRPAAASPRHTIPPLTATAEPEGCCVAGADPEVVVVADEPEPVVVLVVGVAGVRVVVGVLVVVVVVLVAGVLVVVVVAGVFVVVVFAGVLVVVVAGDSVVVAGESVGRRGRLGGGRGRLVRRRGGGLVGVGRRRDRIGAVRGRIHRRGIRDGGRRRLTLGAGLGLEHRDRGVGRGRRRAQFGVRADGEESHGVRSGRRQAVDRRALPLRARHVDDAGLGGVHEQDQARRALRDLTARPERHGRRVGGRLRDQRHALARPELELAAGIGGGRRDGGRRGLVGRGLGLGDGRGGGRERGILGGGGRGGLGVAFAGKRRGREAEDGGGGGGADADAARVGGGSPPPSPGGARRRSRRAGGGVLVHGIVSVSIGSVQARGNEARHDSTARSQGRSRGRRDPEEETGRVGASGSARRSEWGVSVRLGAP